jgi:hypothetical protein
VDLVAAAVNAGVIAAVGLILAWLARGQFEAMRHRFDAMGQRFDAVDQRIDRLEERLDRRLDAMQGSIDAVRSDLTQVALAVGVRHRATNA